MKYEKTPVNEYLIADELLNSEAYEELFSIFSDLEGLVTGNLPESLLIEPARLVQVEFEERTGLYLTRQEIVDAYIRFSGEVYY